MRQITTQKPSRNEITTPQTTVLTALLAGSTVTDAAKQAGLDRTTIHRWLRDDWKFQAALNRGRTELKKAAEARLLHLAHQAADTVARAVEDGDVQAALAVLKGFGFLTGTPAQIGRDDPETLREEKEIADKQDRVERQFWALSPL